MCYLIVYAVQLFTCSDIPKEVQVCRKYLDLTKCKINMIGLQYIIHLGKDGSVGLQ